MEEYDRIVKDLKELSAALKAFLIALFFKTEKTESPRPRFIKSKLNSNTWKLITWLLIAGLGGFVLGRVTYQKEPRKPFSFSKFFFGKIFDVPGLQKDGTFVLADFEHETDLKAWAVADATIELSPQYASQGKQSGRLYYLGDRQKSTAYMSDYFENPKAMDNWSAFEYLSVFFYNPNKETERIILQVKDKKGHSYKENLHLPGESGKAYTTEIAQIAGSIDVRDIDVLRFFRWEPKQDRELFIDDVKLLPYGYQKADLAPQKQNIEFQDRPVNPVNFGFTVKKNNWTVDYPNALGQVVRIPFTVKNETSSQCTRCQAEGGLPLPQGELFSLENIHLKNINHEMLGFHRSILAKWPDSSIKWLRVSFPADIKPNDTAAYFFEYGPNIDNPVSEDKFYTEDMLSLVVKTGPLEAEFSKKKFYLFQNVKLDKNGDGAFSDEELILREAPLRLKFRGDWYQTHLDDKSYKISVESDSAERLVVRAEGWFVNEDGERFSKVIVRYYFYKDSSVVKIAHTLIYTGYPSNNYNPKYSGLNLPDNEMIESLEIVLPLQNFTHSVTQLSIGQEDLNPAVIKTEKSTGISQLSWDHVNLESETDTPAIVNQPNGWLDVTQSQHGLAVGLRNFRENYPKAFQWNAGEKQLHVSIWPETAGPLDLSTTASAAGPDAEAKGSAFGLAKTHEIQFYFHDAEAPAAVIKDKAESFMRPLLIRSNPYWIEAAGVFGYLFPATPRYRREEMMLSDLFDWARRQQEDYKWYGMINFGDTLTGWQSKYNDWHPSGRWGWFNNEGVGSHTGSLLQFVRTGDWKYFEFGSQLARHIMDIDTVHFNTIGHDERLRTILKSEFSRVGSMHRHNADHWGGRNDEATHTNVLGLIYYYQLTGDERTLEVIREIGDFFLKEPFADTEQPEIALHRALANALWSDVKLYELFGEDKYKDAADRIVQIYLNGQETDGSFLEFYNMHDGTWSGEKNRLCMEGYTLGALIAYHQLTQDAQVGKMLLAMVDFLGDTPESIHGNAYAFYLTGNARYLEKVNNALKYLVKKQEHSRDRLQDGIINQKRNYDNVMTYLYAVPYAFSALEATAQDMNISDIK